MLKVGKPKPTEVLFAVIEFAFSMSDVFVAFLVEKTQSVASGSDLTPV